MYSTAVVYLNNFDIELFHPLIVQCIHVCIMKVFRRKKNKEGCEKVERREGARGKEDEKEEIRTGGERKRKEGKGAEQRGGKKQN